MKLEIELVPQNVWGKNLRNMMGNYRWNKLRQKILNEKGKVCSICQAQSKILHIDEMYEYDTANHVQKLIGFRVLCAACHLVKHFGRAEQLAARGEIDINNIINHFCTVNSCTLIDFYVYRKKVYKEWLDKNKYKWTNDLGEFAHYLEKDAFVKVVKPLPENVVKMLNTSWAKDIAVLSSLSIDIVRKAKHGKYSERTRDQLIKAAEQLEFENNNKEMELLGMYYDETSGDYVTEEEMEDIEINGGVHDND